MVSKKEALAEHLALRDDQFTFEVSRRKVLEADLAWVLQKGVVCVVDRVLESSEFALGNRHGKDTCVAAGIERGKQMVRVWSAGSGPGSFDLDAMHVVIRAFSKTDFVSYHNFLTLGSWYAFNLIIYSFWKGYLMSW